MAQDQPSAAPLKRDQALAYIIEHYGRHGFCPTLDEIGLALGGISQPRVRELIGQLVKLGSISRTTGKQRNLRVNDVSACRDHLTEVCRRLRWSTAQPLGPLQAPLPQEKLPRVPPLRHLPSAGSGAPS